MPCWVICELQYMHPQAILTSSVQVCCELVREHHRHGARRGGLDGGRGDAQGREPGEQGERELSTKSVVHDEVE